MTAPEAPLSAGALNALRNNQRQLDFDGCEVGVSRQALDEAVAFIDDALDTISALQAQVGELEQRAEFIDKTWYERCQQFIKRAVTDEAQLRVQAPEWRGIDDEAKKLKRVDLWGRSGKRSFRVASCYWHRKAQRWMSDCHDNEGYSHLRQPFVPTHYRLIPAPPATAEEV